MNKNHVGPNLINTETTKKILNELGSQSDNYWGPTKESAKTLSNFFKDKIFFIVVIVFIILFLVYRYRQVKIAKDMKLLRNNDDDVNELKDKFLKMYEAQKNKLSEPIY
jgi:hypothetical protein